MGPWIWVAGAAAVIALAREAWLHLFVPALAEVLRTRGRTDAARALLELAVRAPSLFGARAAASERYRLAWLYMEEGRYEDAAAQCRAVLQRRLPPALEATIRQRLAHALEGAGDADAAEAERRRAIECLEKAPPGPDLHRARAADLEQRRQYAEACEQYELALDLLPSGQALARAETLVRLALASVNAGRPVETVRRAEEALALKPPPDLMMGAHSAAGIGSSCQGLLEEAERHWQSAFSLAQEAGNRGQAARYLAALAAVRKKRGSLNEAIRDCQEATALSRDAWRTAGLCEAEAMRALGRCDQARIALDRARRAPALAEPSAERRSQGVLDLFQAAMEAESGQPEEAQRCLESAAAAAGGDPRLELWVETAAAWILALRGESAKARERLAAARESAPRFSDDPGTRQFHLEHAARAHFALSEYEDSRKLWQELLDTGPEPLERPTAYYHLGECCLRLGAGDAARAAFAAAVRIEIDCHDSRRARQRLRQLEERT